MLFKFKYLVFILGLAAGASAWASGGSSPKPPQDRTLDKGIKLFIDSSVSPDQSDLISKDLDYLAGSNVPDDKVLSDLLGIAGVNATTLRDWLGAHIRFVVGQSYQPEKQSYVAQSVYAYDNPGVFPDEITNLINGISSTFTPVMLTTAGETQFTTVNLGAGVYLAGKIRRTLMGLKVAGQDVEIRSPRVGIFGIGPKFNESLTPASAIDSAANSIRRLRAYFHESRHGDGNAKSLTFPHAVCPEGHDYAGSPVCDRNLNGAYEVGAEITRFLMNNCATCTTVEKQVLQATYLDEANRKLPDSEVRKTDADTQMLIKALKSQAEVYQMQIENETDPDKRKVYTDKLNDIVAQIKKLEDSLVVRREPTTKWDTSPEGVH